MLGAFCKGNEKTPPAFLLMEFSLRDIFPTGAIKLFFIGFCHAVSEHIFYDFRICLILIREITLNVNVSYSHGFVNVIKGFVYHLLADSDFLRAMVAQECRAA